MPSLQIATTYQPICDCRNTYGDELRSEAEALRFIRESPRCSGCEAGR